MPITKRENGKEFTAKAYAYVPDPQKPSTWKLRMEEEPGKVTVAQLGRAAAALSSGGFRGNRADIPEGDLPAVKRRLRAAYRRLGVKTAEMPESVKLSEGEYERSVFLSEIEPHEVTYEAGEHGLFVVRGLPLIRKGTFNRLDYTDAHLAAILENFVAGRDELGFEPPLRPFHANDDTPIDVRKDTLGYISDIYARNGALFADIEGVDEETVRRLQTKQYRYTSPEFHYTYEGPGTRLRALAFVDNPAMKGMPWTLVANSEEFPEGRDAVLSGGGVECASQNDNLSAVTDEEVMRDWQSVTDASGIMSDKSQGGETPKMTALRDRIAALFAKQPEATPADVAALLSEEESPEVVALRERAEAAEAQLAEQRQAEAARLSEQRNAETQAAVEALLAERRILPAQQEHALALLRALSGQEVALAEDQTEKRDLGAEFLAFLREGQQISEKYFRQTSLKEPDEEALQAKAARMAESVGAS